MNWEGDCSLMLQAVGGFIHGHREILSLYAYFLVMSMEPKLPWPFCLFPPIEWLYELQRNALQSMFTFMRQEKKAPVATAVEKAPTPAVNTEVEQQHPVAS